MGVVPVVVLQERTEPNRELPGEGKSPCFKNRRTRTLNHNSTWFSHEPCVGVKWKTCLCSGSLRNARRSAPVRNRFSISGTLHNGAITRQTSRLQWVFRPSTTQSNRSTSGNRRATWARWAAKSTLVRVGSRSVMTSPVGTTSDAIRVRVPWRI
jgi:hypothetical protein